LSALSGGTIGGVRVRAVLFDYAHTLFHPAFDEQWIENASRASGFAVADGTLDAILAIVAEREGAASDFARDRSAQAHRSFYEGVYVDATGDWAFAAALYEGILTGWTAYPDAASTVAALRERGIVVGVISNIGWDIRPSFAEHGIAVDAFVLSCEEGVSKPDPRLFATALERLGSTAATTLMVGDDPRSDGGAVRVGIPTFILPEPRGVREVRGLGAVLPLAFGGDHRPLRRS
jgi:putative hydrolase of the HAD superfamily